MEKWKPIFGRKYEISNCGRMRSWCKNKLTPHYKKLGIDSTGYFRTNIYYKGKNFTPRIHKLVLENFGLPKPSEKHEVAHNDGNPLNNHISNLRWATRKENLADMKRHGTVLVGEKNTNAKFADQDIINIRKMRSSGEKIQAIATKYNVTKGAIQHIIRRRRWKHVP